MTDKKDPMDLEPSLPKQCPTDLMLLRVRSGELEPEQSNRILQHLSGCERCAGRFSEMEREVSLFWTRHNLDDYSSRVIARGNRTASVRRWVRSALPLAACSIALICIAFLCQRDDARGTRVKGDLQPGISVFVLRDGEIRQARPGDRFRARDRIQIRYTSAVRAWLSLVDVDAKGKIWNFNPPGAPRGIQIGPGIQRPLDHSIELDDASEPERIFALFCEEPVDFTAIEFAARVAPLAFRTWGGITTLERLPVDCPQASFLVIRD